MAEIKNKFNIGDTKWCIFDFKAFPGIIKGMYVADKQIFYAVSPFIQCGVYYKEDELFDTKEEAQHGRD